MKNWDSVKKNPVSFPWVHEQKCWNVQIPVLACYANPFAFEVNRRTYAYYKSKYNFSLFAFENETQKMFIWVFGKTRVNDQKLKHFLMWEISSSASKHIAKHIIHIRRGTNALGCEVYNILIRQYSAR